MNANSTKVSSQSGRIEYKVANLAEEGIGRVPSKDAVRLVRVGIN
jgi:hypothetical protein